MPKTLSQDKINALRAKLATVKHDVQQIRAKAAADDADEIADTIELLAEVLDEILE